MTRAPIIPAPPLVPSSQEGWVTPSEGVDSLIRFVWALHLHGDVTWRGAGHLHDRLVELRDGRAAA
jgi:hypothetical protein